MLGSHAFKAVRQQQCYPAQPAPFFLRRNDELIDNRLRRIPEIAELRLPHHQTVGCVKAVAVLKTQHADLGQRTVVNTDRRLAGRQILERLEEAAGFVVVQYRMTVIERTALRILTGESNSASFDCQGCERQRLTGSPIE